MALQSLQKHQQVKSKTEKEGFVTNLEKVAINSHTKFEADFNCNNPQNQGIKPQDLY